MTALISGAVRLLLVWAMTRLSFAAGADLSLGIYQRTLYQPYLVHCSRNSSEIINGISLKANGVIYSIIVPTLTIISSTIILVTILGALLLVDTLVAISVFAGFGLLYFLVIKISQKQLLKDGQRIADESTNVIKAIQEGLGGIRDVLIDANQQKYCKIYRSADLPLRRAQGNNFFISSSPRFAMEALGMSFIAIVAYSLVVQPEGINKAIPILGAIAVGAQRLLPVMQQAYSGWSSIRGGQASLSDTLDLLDQPLPEYANEPPPEPLPFKEKISLVNVNFSYGDKLPYVLKNLNLTIKKGTRIGFIGETGSGKSTLIDLIMSLLEPTNGSLEVDGTKISSLNSRQWQRHISHVPQSIFLADSTIEENIAFGVPSENIDEKKVHLAAKRAQISSSIEKLPDKYKTKVGERGIRLSGGQRQRVGIARALYKNADVIIFDEATSALDTETEKAVMQTIESLSTDLTLLIIAHRVSTLSKCDCIVQISDGTIKGITSYEEVKKNSFGF